MKKWLSVTLCIVLFLVSVAGCATFEKFNPSYVKEFRRELKSEYDCYESLEIKIGFGDTLLVHCYCDDSDRSEALELEKKLMDFLCERQLVEDYLDAINAPFGYDPPPESYRDINLSPKISLSFYIGSQRQNRTLPFTHDEETDELGYTHIVHVYDGFPGYESWSR